MGTECYENRAAEDGRQKKIEIVKKYEVLLNSSEKKVVDQNWWDLKENSDEILLHERIVERAKSMQEALFKPVFYTKPLYKELRLADRTEATLTVLLSRANYYFNK